MRVIDYPQYDGGHELVLNPCGSITFIHNTLDYGIQLTKEAFV